MHHSTPTYFTPVPKQAFAGNDFQRCCPRTGNCNSSPIKTSTGEDKPPKKNWKTLQGGCRGFHMFIPQSPALPRLSSIASSTEHGHAHVEIELPYTRPSPPHTQAKENSDLQQLLSFNRNESNPIPHFKDLPDSNVVPPSPAPLLGFLEVKPRPVQIAGLSFKDQI